MNKGKHKGRKKYLIGAAAVIAVLVVSLVLFYPTGAPNGSSNNNPLGPASISGYVSDANGEPVAGAYIYGTGAYKGYVVRTGSDGYFQAQQLPSGATTFWAVYNPNILTNQRSLNQTVTLTDSNTYLSFVVK